MRFIAEAETRIGYLDVTTTSPSAHFYVQREHPYQTPPNSVIPWELERLNLGNSFAMGSGVFTAPKDGLYHLTFSGVKEFRAVNPLHLQLRRDNGLPVVAEAYAGIGDTGIAGQMTLSLHSTLRLKTADRLHLYLFGEGNLVDNPAEQNSHFTGWLLEEDLLL